MIICSSVSLDCSSSLNCYFLGEIREDCFHFWSILDTLYSRHTHCSELKNHTCSDGAAVGLLPGSRLDPLASHRSSELHPVWPQTTPLQNINYSWQWMVIMGVLRGSGIKPKSVACKANYTSSLIFSVLQIFSPALSFLEYYLVYSLEFNFDIISNI